jgi:hypothetical protein
MHTMQPLAGSRIKMAPSAEVHHARAKVPMSECSERHAQSPAIRARHSSLDSKTASDDHAPAR